MIATPLTMAMKPRCHWWVDDPNVVISCGLNRNLLERLFRQRYAWQPAVIAIRHWSMSPGDVNRNIIRCLTDDNAIDTGGMQVEI